MGGVANGPRLRRFLEAAAKELSDYEIGFAKLKEDHAPREAYLGGSGTLVAVNGTHAILTADHVIENLPSSGKVGLILPSRFTPQAHRVTLQMELVRKVRIARGADNAQGPDLGLLILAGADAEKLKATKSFYNLSKRRERMLSEPPSIDVGAWLLCGMADEWTSDAPPEMGYETVKVFKGICGAGIVTTEYSDEEFDYLVFEAKYDGVYEGPERYEGFSGGGLWQLLVEDMGDELRTTQKLLSGVVFYQSDIEGNLRRITCHGRKSIYEAAVNTLASNASEQW